LATNVESFDAVVLGAGGAGLMAAAIAGQQGARVLILEHCEQPGKKILISGGGRCNFTNIHTAPDRYISANPHFATSALKRYSPHDFLNLVESAGIAWHEKTLGQLFCDGSAKQIVALLLREIERVGVTLKCNAAITDVRHAGAHFYVHYGQSIAQAPALVIATGGPSIPKMGATGFAYALAHQFGLKVETPRPALVPLTLDETQFPYRDLAGVATPVIAKCERTAFEEAALFTHRGLSGPAILQISSFWQPGLPIALNFTPTQIAIWLQTLKRERPRLGLRGALTQIFPARLADFFATEFNVSAELANIPNQQLEKIEHRLAHWAFQPLGTEGFAKAEVTAGGISTDELSSKTMMTKKILGLFAIGEAVDVTGWLGGYNFQWAWSSGWAAGQAIATFVRDQQELA
jgi:predicted Rossmann fold flavoprotein